MDYANEFSDFLTNSHSKFLEQAMLNGIYPGIKINQWLPFSFQSTYDGSKYSLPPRGINIYVGCFTFSKSANGAAVQDYILEFYCNGQRVDINSAAQNHWLVCDTIVDPTVTDGTNRSNVPVQFLGWQGAAISPLSVPYPIPAPGGGLYKGGELYSFSAQQYIDGTGAYRHGSDILLYGYVFSAGSGYARIIAHDSTGVTADLRICASPSNKIMYGRITTRDYLVYDSIILQFSPDNVTWVSQLSLAVLHYSFSNPFSTTIGTITGQNFDIASNFSGLIANDGLGISKWEVDVLSGVVATLAGIFSIVAANSFSITPSVIAVTHVKWVLVPAVVSGDDYWYGFSSQRFGSFGVLSDLMNAVWGEVLTPLEEGVSAP